MGRESGRRSKHSTVTDQVRNKRKHRYKLLQGNIKDLELLGEGSYGSFSDATFPSQSSASVSRSNLKHLTNGAIKSAGKHRPPSKLRDYIQSQDRNLKKIIRPTNSSAAPKIKKNHDWSDYGSISKGSMKSCFSNTKGTLTSSQSLQNAGRLSSGCWSGVDLNDSMSNLSIDDCKGMLRSIGDDAVDGGRRPGRSGPSFLSLGDLKLSKLSTTFKVVNDIHILLPSQGYCLPMGASSPLEDLIKIDTLNLNIADKFLEAGLRLCQSSPVISIEPHGTLFCALYPAIIQVPLKVDPSSGDQVYFLYSEASMAELSGPSSGLHNWSCAGECTIKDGKAVIETFRFGIFVVVIRPKTVYRSLTKDIKASQGGFLDIPGFPAIQVQFPRNVTGEDIVRANAKVHFDTEQSLSEFLASRPLDSSMLSSYSLATPIIQLEPHGTIFGSDPVMITLPVPDYNKIMSLYGATAVLSIWQSDTHPSEQSKWEELHVTYRITYGTVNGHEIALMTFPVSHFSCFKGMWSIVLRRLCQTRFGMVNFFVSFVMSCRAYMQEYPGSAQVKEKDSGADENGRNDESLGGNRFGLQVLVYNGEDKEPSPHLRMFDHKVGQALAKLVKPGGKMVTCFESNDVEPDGNFGEEKMVVEESCFYGQDFDAQFALRFKEGAEVKKGPFGQVSVSRPEGQNIYKFKLFKQGNEDRSPDVNSKDWTMVRLTDLADSFAVTEGSNWKKFAIHLGMTMEDIYNSGLMSATNPFQKLVEVHMADGGSSKSIADALYKYSRKLDVSGPSSGETRRFKRASAGSSGYGPSFENAASSRRRSYDSDTSARSQDSGLQLRTDRSPSSSSPRESPNLDYTTKLKDTYLWKASELLNCRRWKHVGRTLGVEEQFITEINDNRVNDTTGYREKAYQMLLQWKQLFPRRCSQGHLYLALQEHKMNDKAKELRNIRIDHMD